MRISRRNAWSCLLWNVRLWNHWVEECEKLDENLTKRQIEKGNYFLEYGSSGPIESNGRWKEAGVLFHPAKPLRIYFSRFDDHVGEILFDVTDWVSVVVAEKEDRNQQGGFQLNMSIETSFHMDYCISRSTVKPHLNSAIFTDSLSTFMDSI